MYWYFGDSAKCAVGIYLLVLWKKNFKHAAIDSRITGVVVLIPKGKYTESDRDAKFGHLNMSLFINMFL
jgi:hypothetical protein